jgi:hypothetical protein
MLSPLARSCLGQLIGIVIATSHEPALKDIFTGKLLFGAALNTNIATNPDHPAKRSSQKTTKGGKSAESAG